MSMSVKDFFNEIIGVPGVGIHSYRIFDIAYMDVIVVLIGSILLAWVFKWRYIRTIVGMFIFGIVVHRFFDVRTTVDKLIFS
jgi:hypothetical protein